MYAVSVSSPFTIQNTKEKYKYRNKYKYKYKYNPPEALPVRGLLLLPLHHLSQACSKLRPLNLHDDDDVVVDDDDHDVDYDGDENDDETEPFHSHLGLAR